LRAKPPQARISAPFPVQWRSHVSSPAYENM
jgi:hypothetical protein